MFYKLFLFFFFAHLAASEVEVVFVDGIECYCLIPEGTGPFPALFLLHGYQPQDKNIGSKEFVEFKSLEKLTNEGIAAIAISLPGFGNSKGPWDFCGLSSQQAVLNVIEYFKNQSVIDPKRMGLYGVSLGATLGSMVSSRSSDVALQILESGCYDLVTWSSLLPDYLQGIKNNITEATGNQHDELIMRSSIYHADKIVAKTLLLHGEFDDRRGLPSAKILHDKLQSSELRIYQNQLHGLLPEKWDAIIIFLRNQFLDLYGIGIQVSDPRPALQVAKVFPSSPSLGKLRVGDVILKIEGQDSLRMPLKHFVRKLLGPKGSRVHLTVQHFDQTCEELLIERN